jgi:hypothetical protein
MSLSPFQPSPALFLEADGQVRRLEGLAGGGGFVVLARGRCLFGQLDTPPEAKGKAVAAARMHARTAAPYPRSGVVVTRHGRRFGFWWWDAAWVAEQLQAAGLDGALRVVPEPFMRPAGEGWRIVKAGEGYEAQVWSGGFLTADLWRKRPFDAAAWGAFARSQPDEAGPAPSAPPPAQTLPLTARSAYRRTMLASWRQEGAWPLAAAAAALVLICLTALLAGRALRLGQETGAVRSQIAALQAVSPPGGSQSAMRRLTMLKAALQHPDAAALLQNAREIIDPFGFVLTSFSADGQKVRLVLPAEAAPVVGPISEALGKSPYFTDIKPRLDAGAKQLVIDMAVKGAGGEAAKDGTKSGAAVS